MNGGSYFLYFLDSVKDSLLFEDIEDFLLKIKKDFQFRHKVQKFVYIAKYFGWNHSYEYVFYLRGPYSNDLANEYYNVNISQYVPLKIENFESKSFNAFVLNKSNDYLEAVSTILYNNYIQKGASVEEIISNMDVLKPHLESSIVYSAYNDIIKYDIAKNLIDIDSHTIELDSIKITLMNKISSYINKFKHFNRCNNSVIISGSLNYLHMALKEENLDFDMKNDLLILIDDYVEYIAKIYYLCGDNSQVFEEMNLDNLEEFFDRLQNYIGEELNVIPRLDDDEFDERFY